MPTIQKWIGPNGRVIALDLGERREAIPDWLVDKLLAYAKRFDWGITFDDPWDILLRVNTQVVWKGEWGTATLASGVDVFVSGIIPRPEQLDVVTAADRLGVSYAFAPDGRFAFAERARVWR